jgi:hypothetical protein
VYTVVGCASIFAVRNPRLTAEPMLSRMGVALCRSASLIEFQ